MAFSKQLFSSSTTWHCGGMLGQRNSPVIQQISSFFLNRLNSFDVPWISSEQGSVLIFSFLQHSIVLRKLRQSLYVALGLGLQTVHIKKWPIETQYLCHMEGKAWVLPISSNTENPIHFFCQFYPDWNDFSQLLHVSVSHSHFHDLASELNCSLDYYFKKLGKPFFIYWTQ